MNGPLKSYPPLIDPKCQLIGQVYHDHHLLVDDGGAPVLVDLSGGMSVIEWNPALSLMWSGRLPFVERGIDSYNLRVWKRRHGILNVTGGAYLYDEPAYSDPWADWLDQHLDLEFLMAGVAFRIVSVQPFRNGVDYWLTGRRVGV